MVKIPIDKPQEIKVDYAGRILSKDELKAVVKEVNQSEKDFYGVGVLDRPVKIRNGELTYDLINGRELINVLMNEAILVNGVVIKKFPGVYVSTRDEKEKALEAGLDHTGICSYDSLCLGGIDLTGRRLGGRELDFASRLVRVLNENGSDVDLVSLQKRVEREPALIPMAYLRLERDGNFGFHYSICPKGNEIIFDKKLKQGVRFDKAESKTGLPIFGRQGARAFYSNHIGLQGVCLNGRLDIVLSSGDEPNMNDSYLSRIVLTDTREASRD